MIDNRVCCSYDRWAVYDADTSVQTNLKTCWQFEPAKAMIDSR